MEFNGRLEMKSTDIIVKEHGLGEMGEVQKFIDNETIKRMTPYTPALSTMLSKSTASTVIGSGRIVQNSPYARFQYYGMLMVSSITGSAFASKGESKVLTDTPLQYSKAVHPNAGKLWFERMKEAEKEEILKGAQKIADRGGKK